MNVRVGGQIRQYRTVSFDAEQNAVALIEQRRLPHQFQIVQTRDYQQTAAAIRDMVVRGAGAIGATAAYGLAQGALAFSGVDTRKFGLHIERVFETLKAARPTAVDPVNAMEQVRRAMKGGLSVRDRQALALAAAEEFANEDVRHCEEIGRHGARLIRNGMKVLTHCNAGWLAFVDIGSATAPLYAAQAQAKKFHVYCDETRPRCQGATLTAWEMAQQGISHQVIADNAAGHLMQRGEIDLVIVGSDRTLGRTGEVANKIGTYTKAVLAKRHRIPFYVAIPLSTIDWNLKSGADIPIEQRDEREVLGAWGVIGSPKSKVQSPKSREGRGSGVGVQGSGFRIACSTLSKVHGPWSVVSGLKYVRIANPSSRAFNPGFDVTPPDLITGIITPLGIFKPRDLWKKRSLLSSK
ncbi:MAG: S-methyl-5-thioribose-1-phosphate isomerase [Verrucomicrobia bacterium]|nr:MAG: S-methyl-5-thioribose-1-phosphate isomerase [Verrucomicrobiota bacterium]